MKKKSLILSALLFFSILPIPLFTSCDKDTNSYLEVLVTDEATKAPISGVKIEILQTNGGNVHDNGITNAKGKCNFKFVSPAIVKVKAVLQLPENMGGGERRGETQVRLLEGETLTAKISLTSQVYY